MSLGLARAFLSALKVTVRDKIAKKKINQVFRSAIPKEQLGVLHCLVTRHFLIAQVELIICPLT